MGVPPQIAVWHHLMCTLMCSVQLTSAESTTLITNFVATSKIVPYDNTSGLPTQQLALETKYHVSVVRVLLVTKRVADRRPPELACIGDGVTSSPCITSSRKNKSPVCEHTGIRSSLQGKDGTEYLSFLVSLESIGVTCVDATKGREEGSLGRIDGSRQLKIVREVTLFDYWVCVVVELSQSEDERVLTTLVKYFAKQFSLRCVEGSLAQYPITLSNSSPIHLFEGFA